MRKALIPVLGILLIMLAAILTPASPSALVLIGGTVTGPDGNPLNGTMRLTLSNPGQNTANNTAVVVYPIQFSLVAGHVPAFAQVVPNDAINPRGTYYVEELYDTQGNLLAQNNFYITSPGPFDIGQAAPTSLTTSQITYLNPAFVSTANTWTGVQTFTNLVQSTVETIFGGSNTTIYLGGQLTQYRGTPVADQTVVVIQAPIPSGCTASSGPITLWVPTAPGQYRLSGNFFNIANGGTGTFGAHVNWTSGGNAMQFFLSGITLSSVGQYSQGTVTMYPDVSTAITIQFTSSGTPAGSTCNGMISLELL